MLSWVSASSDPPLRLVLGGDALARMRGKLASVAQEVEKWQDTTLATAFIDLSRRNQAL